MVGFRVIGFRCRVVGFKGTGFRVVGLGLF